MIVVGLLIRLYFPRPLAQLSKNAPLKPQEDSQNSPTSLLKVTAQAIIDGASEPEKKEDGITLLIRGKLL